jgi:uncharacterized protein
MKLICIEEHAIDPAIAKAAQPALDEQAPYLRLQNSGDTTPRSRNPHRPTMVPMDEALRLGADLGTGRIADMDKHGIDMQVVSYSSVAQLAPADQAAALAQAANNRLAAAVTAHPGRLAGFAVLPWQDPQAAADELDRAVTQLGFKGSLITNRPGPTFLDDPRYAPVLQKLSDLQVPLYLHPGHPLPQVQQAYYGGLAPEITAQLSLHAWGWHNEAGIHLLRLILSGTFEKFPGLQVISGHWGEMVPFFLQRLDDCIRPEVAGLSQTITETYRSRVWITPSGMFDLPHFEFIRTVIGIDRIIWAVDYPYVTLDGTREFLTKLPVSDTDKEKITHLNAEKLFRL